jgi:hypothetical protein
MTDEQRKMVRDMIDGLEHDQQIMAASLAPVQGCSVLDGTAFVLAKVEDDGSTTGYVHHETIDGKHSVAFNTAYRASRWSLTDCEAIARDEIVVTTGRLIAVHWHDAYTAQMDKNADLLANLYRML